MTGGRRVSAILWPSLIVAAIGLGVAADRGIAGIDGEQIAHERNMGFEAAEPAHPVLDLCDDLGLTVELEDHVLPAPADMLETAHTKNPSTRYFNPRKARSDQRGS